MSRIGKRIIQIPETVTVEITGEKVKVTGPKGELTKEFSPLITIIKTPANELRLTPKNNAQQTMMLYGTTNSLLYAMIEGVVKGFQKELEINGVGYNVIRAKDKLTFTLGFSHKIEKIIPEGIEVEVPKPTVIIIRGINKQQVGQFAAQIRLLKKPEPYGGKGIKYKDEVIIRKAGKSGAK